jgi:hypothetical protein
VCARRHGCPVGIARAINCSCITCHVRESCHARERQPLGERGRGRTDLRD